MKTLGFFFNQLCGEKENDIQGVLRKDDKNVRILDIDKSFAVHHHGGCILRSLKKFYNKNLLEFIKHGVIKFLAISV